MSLCTVHNTDCKTEKSFSVSITSRRKLGVISATCPAILSAFTQSLFSTALPSLTLWLVYLHNKEVNVSVEYVSVTFQQEIFTGHGNTLSLTSLNKDKDKPALLVVVFSRFCAPRRNHFNNNSANREILQGSLHIYTRGTRVYVSAPVTYLRFTLKGLADTTDRSCCSLWTFWRFLKTWLFRFHRTLIRKYSTTICKPIGGPVGQHTGSFFLSLLLILVVFSMVLLTEFSTIYFKTLLLSHCFIQLNINYIYRWITNIKKIFNHSFYLLAGILDILKHTILYFWAWISQSVGLNQLKMKLYY